MASANESPGLPLTIAIFGVGVLLAVGLLVLFARRADATPFAAATAYLLMLALGAPSHWVASFGPGMALADTYLTGGGDHSPWALPLYAASGVALVALFAAIAVENVRAKRTPVRA